MPSQAQSMAGDAPASTAKILRVAAGFRVDALGILKELELELTTKLQAMGEVSTPLQKKYVEMLKDANETIAGAYALLGKESTTNLQALATIEALAVDKSLNKSIGVNLFSGKIPPKLLESVANGPVVLGAPAKDWWAGQSADLQKKFKQQMGLGIVQGETNDQLVKRLRGTKANNYTDGLMAISRRDAQTLIRTSSMSVANYARIESFKAKPNVVKGIQWVSTLDSRTTHICKALDGKQWRISDMKPVGHDKAFPGPTAHWNCRSTQIAVTYSWSELANKKLPELDNETLQSAVDEKLKESGMEPEKIQAARVRARASMDGQVADKLTYGDWADEKGGAFVDEVLGPGRAALYKSGLIDFTDLTDQTNRPLTLEELKASVETEKPPPETLGAQFTAPPKQLEAQKIAEALAKAAKEKADAEAAAMAAHLAYKAEVAAKKAAEAEALAAKEAAEKAAAEAKAKAEAEKKAALEKLAAEKAAEMAAKVAEQKAKLEAEKAAAEAAAAAKAKAEAEEAAKLKAEKLLAIQKKWTAKKKLTTAEQDYLHSLPDAEQLALLQEWDDIAAAKEAKKQLAAAKKAEKAAKKAAQDAADALKQASTPEAQKLAVVAANTAAEPAPNVPHPSDLKFYKALGGSTGAELHKAPDGSLWVVKKGASPDHVREEWTADQAYKALGVPVPAGHLWEEDGGPVKVTQFIEGKTFGQLTKKEQDAAAAKMRQHFAADALMGNWDVYGQSLDNVLVATDGTPYRIDNGGSLRFRAMGSKKTGDQWGGTPRDWFTMREKSNGAGKYFADVDVVDASRFIESWDLSRLEAINMDSGLRETLMERARELRVMATRNLDMHHDGIVTAYFDKYTAKTWELKDAGLREMIPTGPVKMQGASTGSGAWSHGSDITLTTNGQTWQGLRSPYGASKTTAQGTPADVAADMPGMAEIKAAAISMNYSAANGQALSASGSAKVTKALSYKPLMEAVSKMDKEPGQEAKAAAAKHALEVLKALEEHTDHAKVPKATPYFDPKGAATKAIGKQPATTAPKVQEIKATSATDLAYKMYGQKWGDTRGMEQITLWMGRQASDSWTPEAQMAKQFLASLRPGGSFFIKPPNTKESIAKQWAAGVARAGGEDKLLDAFTTWHAMTGEILRTYAAPFVDKERRVVRLYRTNPVEALPHTVTGGKAKLTVKAGDEVPMSQQGAAESHSVFRPTKVYESHLVEQAVPWHRVLGTYWTERSPGSRMSSFLGDGENELVADGGGIPGRFLGLGVQAGKVHKDEFNATGWNVPLGHLRNQ